jgi:hypothetical protein
MNVTASPNLVSGLGVERLELETATKVADLMSGELDGFNRSESIDAPSAYNSKVHRSKEPGGEHIEDG